MNKNVDDKMHLRRRNLVLLKEQTRDEWQTLAKRLKVTKAYISQISTGHRPFTEKTAKSFEARLNLATGWFDAEHERSSKPGLASQSSDEGLLMRLIPAIDRALKAAGKVAFREDEKYGRLLELLYEDSTARGIPDETWIARLVKLILD